MLGASKTLCTQRLNDEKTAYAVCLEGVKGRWSPVKQYKDELGYRTKAKHILLRAVIELSDIRVSDRIVYCEEMSNVTETYVVAGLGKNTDTLGKHITALLRGVATHVHTDVAWLTPSSSQPNYDPIFEEFVGGDQGFDSTTLKVLLDPIESAREAFIKYIEAGKLGEVDWIMTVDFPDTVLSSHKIAFDGVTYEVKWSIPQPFQTLVGLKKTIQNYVADTGDSPS